MSVYFNTMMTRVCVWTSLADRRIHTRVFLAHLQPPLVAVDQPLQPLAIHLRRPRRGRQAPAEFAWIHKDRHAALECSGQCASTTDKETDVCMCRAGSSPLGGLEH